MCRPCFCLALLLTLAPAAAADDFRNLFDGKSLDGWVVEGPAKGKTGKPMWSVEDGQIVCLGEGFGFLRYTTASSSTSFHIPGRVPGSAPMQRPTRGATAGSVSGRGGSTPRP